MSRLVVFVESPRTGAGQDAARVLVDRGYETVILVNRPEKLDQFLLDDYASIGTEIVAVDTSDPSKVADAAQHIASKRSSELAGVTSVYEYFIEVAAVAAASLGLPTADPNAITTCRSKSAMRKACDATDGLNPKYELVRSPAEAAAAAEAIGYPVVVKPVDLTGSVFVRQCVTSEEVESTAKYILDQTNYLGVPLSGMVAVEEYLAGPEFSVEMFEGRALGITAKISGTLPYFIELAHQFPAPIPDEIAARIIQTAEEGARAVGLSWGPAHVEVKFTSDDLTEIRLIEVNPRVGGDRVPELVRLATGKDLVAMHMAAVTGDVQPTDGQPAAKAASIRFVRMPDRGRLESIGGIDDAKALGGVVEVHIKNKVGDVYFSHGSNRDRLAHVIATADTPAEALHLATAGADRLDFDWSDVEGELEYV